MRKSERRMNTADWFLILLVLISLGGILFRCLDKRDGAASPLSEFALECRWERVDAKTVACLQSGEVLYTSAGEVFGEIGEIRTSAAEVEMRSNGVLYRLALPTRVDAVIEVKVNGRLSDGAVLSQRGELLSAGQTVRLYSRRAELELKILSVNPQYTA